MNTNFLTNLHNVLAHLYPDENSIRRIIVDSGLNLSHIALNSSPINNWSAVLTDAVKINRVGPLLDVVEREYGNNREFRDACNRYHLSVNETVDKVDDNERRSGQANGQLTDGGRSSTAFKQIHDLESPYGTMKPDSAFYVIRQAGLPQFELLQSCQSYYDLCSITQADGQKFAYAAHGFSTSPTTWAKNCLHRFREFYKSPTQQLGRLSH